jgi:hypothetical protein
MLNETARGTLGTMIGRNAYIKNPGTTHHAKKA